MILYGSGVRKGTAAQHGWGGRLTWLKWSRVKALLPVLLSSTLHYVIIKHSLCVFLPVLGWLWQKPASNWHLSAASIPSIHLRRPSFTDQEQERWRLYMHCCYTPFINSGWSDLEHFGNSWRSVILDIGGIFRWWT